MSRARRILEIMALLAVGSCCGGDVACVNILEVDFDQPAAYPFRVEVLTPADSVLGQRDCTDARACDAQRVLVPAGPAPKVVVKVFLANGVVTGNLTPSYREFTPNGPYCTPVCHSAIVGMAIGSPVPDTIPRGNP